MTDADIIARIDVLERAQADLQSEVASLRRQLSDVQRDVRAAVDQAKYCVRKFDQLRAALADQVPIAKTAAGQA